MTGKTTDNKMNTGGMTTGARMRRSAGFSMVEIMVGIVISMISTLIVMQVFSTFEGQKRTTTSGSDAQTNGGLGLYNIERDVRIGGYGLGNATGCQMDWAYGGVLPPLTLAPVSIDNIPANGNPGNIIATDNSDSITIIASNSQSFSVPMRPLVNYAQGGDQMPVDTLIGAAPGDLMVLYENISATPTCSLLQVGNTATPVQSPLLLSSGSWNASKSQVVPSSGYSSNAQLMNLGSLMLRTYGLDANNNLIVVDLNTSNNTYTAQTLSTDVVSLQAQYGFDTRPGAQADAQVDTWNHGMIDADNSGTAGDQGDWQRIYALRIFLVARSGLKEKAQSDGTCNITTTAPTPSWATAPVDLSKNPDGSSNTDWQCYRYKTFETVVPIRSRVWKS